MRNPFFNPDTVQAAMLRHELSLIPQREAFAAALASCGAGASPLSVALALFGANYPLTQPDPDQGEEPTL